LPSSHLNHRDNKPTRPSNNLIQAHTTKTLSPSDERRFSSIVPTKGAIFPRCTSSGLIKDRDGHGLQIEEITMRLIKRFELAGKTSKELHSLLRQTFNAMASGDNNHKRNAIASMQNIQNEPLSRTCHP